MGKDSRPDDGITKDLLHRLNEGEVKAFEMIFHKYYAALCFFANKFLQDTETAKDVVQEVFINFSNKKYHFANTIALKSFLYSCVQRKSLNYLEKSNNRANIQKQFKESEYQENEYFLHQVESEIFEEIFSAIEELPTECRRIFKMSYIDHLDIRKISEELNIAESTIKTQRQRAKQFLRKRLQNLYPIVVLLFF
ncbi:MAG: RNA polymerase sigma-70 factor [Odoribacter sp.]|nr:RNA polymerase sigma-70 factor [Odoribacter sp.]